MIKLVHPKTLTLLGIAFALIMAALILWRPFGSSSPSQSNQSQTVVGRSGIGPMILGRGNWSLDSPKFSRFTIMNQGDVRQFGDLWLRLDGIEEPGTDKALLSLKELKVKFSASSPVPQAVNSPHQIRLSLYGTVRFRGYSIQFLERLESSDGKGRVSLRIDLPGPTPTPSPRPPVS